MPRDKKKWRARSKPKPFYELKEVKRLAENEEMHIRQNALDEARDAFGWEESDIRDAIVRLRLSHFHKSDELKTKPGIMVDYYKAPGMYGENVYMHFYVHDETGELIINSFKELEVLP